MAQIKTHLHGTCHLDLVILLLPLFWLVHPSHILLRHLHDFVVGVSFAYWIGWNSLVVFK